MNISNAERRQIENEMIFRRVNEKVGDALDALDAMHIEDGNIDLLSDEDLLLQFRCECSDENCSARIPLLRSKYDEIHVDRRNFVILPDHQVDPIEVVIKKTGSYSVVKKNNVIPEPSGSLNSTSIDNS